MPKYINKQRNRWACGHIAVANALKWANKPINYKHAIKEVEKHKISNKNKGSWTHQLQKVLDRYKVKYSIKLKISTKEIFKEIKKGNAAIWLFLWKKQLKVKCIEEHIGRLLIK